MRVLTPQNVTLVVALVLILAVFVPPLETLREECAQFFDILAAFAMVLGAASIVGVHGRKIRSRRKGWGYSVVCLVAFCLTLVIGLGKLGSPAGVAGPPLAQGSPFAWLYDHIYSPTDAAFFSLLAFFVASAAFRAFRMHSREATIMLLTAFLVLLGQTFLGALATDWLPERWQALESSNQIQWLMAVPLTAGNRAIVIGVALGIIVTCLKIILGIERPYLEGGE